MTNTNQYGPWELIVQGFALDDYDNPTDPAHLLLADVKKRLMLEKRKIGSRTGAFGVTEIQDVKLGPGVVRPPDETSSKAYFWLALTIEMVEDALNPYG